MKKRLTNLLRCANLKEEEIKVYLLLLKFSEATIPQIVSKNGLPTITVYRTVKRLFERGLIEEDKLNKKQNIYKSLSLNALIKKINFEERKLSRLKQNLKNLDSLLPFMDIEQEEDEDLIEVHEGIDAFREEYLKIPKLCKNEFLHIGSMTSYWDTAGMSYDSAEERYFINTRMNRGVFARVLNPNTIDAERIKKRDSMEKRIMKIRDGLPVSENYFTMAENQSALFVCDKENPRVIVMKQPDLLALQKAQFKELWEKAG